MAKKPDLLFELYKQTQAAQAAQADKAREDAAAAESAGTPQPATGSSTPTAPSPTISVPNAPAPPTTITAPAPQVHVAPTIAEQAVACAANDGSVDPEHPHVASAKTIRLTHQNIIIATVIAMCVFFAGVLCGRWTAFAAVERASDRAFDAIRHEEPQPDALDVGPVSPLDRVATTDKPASAAASASGAESASINENYTRKPGLNYLIIERFEKRSQAEKAQAFLAEHGVDATIESASESVILVSKVGFDFSTQKTEKESFKRQVETLGLQYVKMAGSDGYDFQTCYFARLSSRPEQRNR